MTLPQTMGLMIAAIPASIGVGIGIKFGNDLYEKVLQKRVHQWLKNVGKIHKKTTKKAIKNTLEVIKNGTK